MSGVVGHGFISCVQGSAVYVMCQPPAPTAVLTELDTNPTAQLEDDDAAESATFSAFRSSQVATSRPSELADLMIAKLRGILPEPSADLTTKAPKSKSKKKSTKKEDAKKKASHRWKSIVPNLLMREVSVVQVWAAVVVALLVMIFAPSRPRAHQRCLVTVCGWDCCMWLGLSWWSTDFSDVYVSPGLHLDNEGAPTAATRHCIAVRCVFGFC
jgi:hypothetical protein